MFCSLSTAGFAGESYCYRPYKANEGFARGADGILHLTEEQLKFSDSLAPFRSLNERVHGRLKKKFRGLVFWSGDREVSLLELSEPVDIVAAWSVCCLLHNVDIQENPMGLASVRVRCDPCLWGWPQYDHRVDVAGLDDEGQGEGGD